jgi:hypothetical protein
VWTSCFDVGVGGVGVMVRLGGKVDMYVCMDRVKQGRVFPCFCMILTILRTCGVTCAIGLYDMG